MAERVVHILPEQVASQIAAGEVVERPASALKELVENSIDAGARSISVEIARSGIGLVMVADDGCGMGREDAILSLRRHATSKVRDVSDLGVIRTLGFRGEALASIASVSHLTMRTRRHGDGNGVELLVKAGEIERSAECAQAPGTRIEVCDLFFNTPARLKFLKSTSAEQTACTDALQRLALPNFRLAFRFVADGRVIWDLPRTASALERLRQLHGGRLASRMLPFDYHGGGIRVWGLATTSQESFPSQRLLMTYVNGRAVRDRMLFRAITQSYQTLLPRGRYPAVALFVEVQPEEVDVNVHPMKTEVRFRHSGAVFEQVYHALRKRLADQADGAVIGEANNSLVDGPVASLGDVRSRAAAVSNSEPQASRSEAPLRLVPDHVSVLLSQRPLPIGFNGTGSSAPAPAPDNPATPRIPNYSSLRIVGQLFAGYIALEGDDGLLLIDQHAAHERVTFEKLRAEMAAGGIRVQSMLTPAPVELNQSRASLVAASLPELRAMGFEAEIFGPATILLKGAPAIFGIGDAIRLFSDMIDSMGEHGFGPRGEAAFEDCLKTLACHGSVRAGRALEPREITELLAALDATQFKTNCPHGRPVHIEFRRGSIERMFRR